MVVTSLITVTLAVFFVLGLAIMRLLKQQVRQAERIHALQDQLAALCEGASGVDARIVKFEQAMSQMREHQHTMDLASASQPVYDHAIRLARRGANTEQMMDQCNLSSEEAHLINRLHGQSLPTH